MKVRLLFTFLAFGTAYAQLPNLIPPSPTASELGKYGDIPVSNYTGVPSISIPIYNVKSGEIELPVSLSYHASGITVAQEASWVGLGWSLNAGGVITRQVNGLDDFKIGTGFIHSEPLPLENANSMTPLWSMFGFTRRTMSTATAEDMEIDDQLNEIEAGMQDGEPDQFSYNFMGYSGKLFFDKQPGNVYTAQTKEQNNLNFKYDRVLEKWEITDANGWRYLFSTKEKSRSKIDIPIEQIYQPWSEDTNTSWYIDKIITPKNDEITFVYKSTNTWIESPPITTNETWRYPSKGQMNTNEIGIGLTEIYTSPRITISYVQTQEVYLDRVNFKGGYLQFDYLNRIDRKLVLNATQSPALYQISVMNSSDTLVNRFNFTYSYFRNDMINSPEKEKYLRLKLDALHESVMDKNGILKNKPPYIFKYNETQLPPKNSYSIDHWGYYNGADNTNIKDYKFIPTNPNNLPGIYVNGTGVFTSSTLIPFYTFIGTHASNNKVKIMINGADREPNKDFVEAGILKSIQYPMGGLTEFQYEPNDYLKQDDYVLTPTIHQITSLGINEKLFSLDEETFVFLEFELTNHNYYADPTNSTIMNQMEAVLEGIGGNDILKFIPAVTSGGNNNTYKMTSNVCVALKPGSYRIKTNHSGYAYLDMSMRIKVMNRVQAQKKLGGGIRIKSIMSYDSPSGLLLKNIEYSYLENGKSTGRLLTLWENFYNETELICKAIDRNQNDANTSYALLNSVFWANNYSIINGGNFPSYFRLQSSTLRPMGGSAQGQSIGYNRVEVRITDEDGLSIGSSMFHFKNFDDVKQIFLPGIPNQPRLENGQLIHEQHFNSSGSLLREKRYNYLQSKSSKIKGLKLSRINVASNEGGCTYGALLTTNIKVCQYYYVHSEWWILKSTTETRYDGNGVNPFSVNIDYEYANPIHKLLTKTTQTNGKGETLVTINEYPSDNPTGTGTTLATMAKMNSDNILSPIIKQEIRLNGTLVDGSINSYTMDSNGKVLLNDIKKLNKISNTFETEIEYQKYDDSGNLLQLKNEKGVTISYLWSYNGMYPVAKGENVTYDLLKLAVESAAGTTDIESFWKSHSNPNENNLIWRNFNNALRSNTSLKNSIISTYTYLPLIGISSTSDANGQSAFFEYDDFKRLKYIRNDKGEIIKKYEYAYSN